MGGGGVSDVQHKGLDLSFHFCSELAELSYGPKSARIGASWEHSHWQDCCIVGKIVDSVSPPLNYITLTYYSAGQKKRHSSPWILCAPLGLPRGGGRGPVRFLPKESITLSNFLGDICNSFWVVRDRVDRCLNFVGPETRLYTLRKKSLNECGDLPSNGFRWKTCIEITIFQWSQLWC